jgi:hypothetical protein
MRLVGLGGGDRRETQRTFGGTRVHGRKVAWTEARRISIGCVLRQNGLPRQMPFYPRLEHPEQGQIGKC